MSEELNKLIADVAVVGTQLDAIIAATADLNKHIDSLTSTPPLLIDPAPNWHRTEDQLPHTKRDVIALSASVYALWSPVIASYDNGQWVFALSRAPLSFNPTHWMDLPPSPLEEIHGIKDFASARTPWWVPRKTTSISGAEG